MCNSKGFSFIFLYYICFLHSIFMYLILIYIFFFLFVLYGFFYLFDTLIGQYIPSFCYVEQALFLEF